MAPALCQSLEACVDGLYSGRAPATGHPRRRDVIASWSRFPRNLWARSPGVGAGEGNENRPRIERIRSSGWSANRKLSRNGLLGSAPDQDRQVGISEVICQASRNAIYPQFSDPFVQNSRYKNGTTKACSIVFSVVPYRALQCDRCLVIIT